jgi:hypothetical protein
MNRRQKSPQPRIKNPAYRPAFERLDAALEENTTTDNRELIRRMRADYFADVDALEASGTIKIPE